MIFEIAMGVVVALVVLLLLFGAVSLIADSYWKRRSEQEERESAARWSKVPESLEDKRYWDEKFEGYVSDYGRKHDS